MKIRLSLFAGAAFALIGSLTAGPLELEPKETAPPNITESEPWQFTIAAPGWLASTNGTIGVRGVNANIDIPVDEVLQHLDMIFAARAEAQKGPFGIYGEVIYIGLSDGAQINGLINNIHEIVNMTLVDGALSWRLINQPRWSLDFAAGTHYTNVYERLTLNGDVVAIHQASQQFVDDITAALRNELNGDLTGGVATPGEQLANAVTAALRNRLNEISNPQLINSLTNAIRTDITAAFRDLLSQRISSGEFVNLLTREIRTELTTALRNQVREDVSNEIVSSLTDALRTDITSALRDRLSQHLSNRDFVTALTNAIRTNITTAFRDQDAIKNAIRKDIINRIGDRLEGAERHPNIPIGPLGGRIRQKVAGIVENYVNVKLDALRARIDALHLEGEARRAAVNRILNAAKAQIANDLAVTLQSKLNQSISKDDYWFDPYVGLRGRYNFNKTFYTAVRGEIGGFGVGADLMWEVEGVLGINLTHSIFTEIGYRALAGNFEENDFRFDVVGHGPQITTGITF